MSLTEKRKLERVRYWQGQMLRSRDFNDIHAVEEQRRWWHNRALHNAYGVHQDPDNPSAFDVSLDASQNSVTVKAGLAYDSFGRELILETDQTVPLPPITASQNEDFLLLARYRMKPSDERGLAGVCFTDSGPLKSAFVEFIWKDKDECSFPDGVPLATLEIRDNQKSLVLIQQNSTRPLARPQLGSGFTVPGNTSWELWASDVETVFGVQTTIDTSAAGFTDAPCYFAWLQGSLFNPQTRELVPALFTSIAEETLDGFVFRIAFPPPPEIILLAAVAPPPIRYIDADGFALFAHKQNLYVNWIGCQPNASAPFFAFLLRNPQFLLGLNPALSLFDVTRFL